MLSRIDRLVARRERILLRIVFLFDSLVGLSNSLSKRKVRFVARSKPALETANELKKGIDVQIARHRQGRQSGLSCGLAPGLRLDGSARLPCSDAE